MAKRKKKQPRVPSTLSPLRDEEQRRFAAAVVTKARQQGLDESVRIPDEIADEVAQDLYGGWTPEAIAVVQRLEAGKPEGQKRFPRKH